jgi:hypothetical protein
MAAVARVIYAFVKAICIKMVHFSLMPGDISHHQIMCAQRESALCSVRRRVRHMTKVFCLQTLFNEARYFCITICLFYVLHVSRLMYSLAALRVRIE